MPDLAHLNRALFRTSSERPKVLIADDERSIREVLSIFLEQSGFEVTCAERADEACALLRDDDYCLVLSDLRMPQGGGMRVLEFLKQIEHPALAIMMTAYASAETAVEAMRLGAHDYLTKPFKLNELKLHLERALEHYRLRQENRELKEVIRAQGRFEGLIGRSEPMRHIFEMIRRVAPAKTPILILGESGTGKEMVAQAIHAQSGRARGPFIALNCAALPEHLLESALFGHRRGAFTGAVEHHEGLFVAAHNGTLFLDEIGEMPLSMQAKVLRALQEQKVMAVGSLDERDVNLRVIAATNRPLLEEVKAGRFREDLYYRLNVIPLNLPPLRERPSDIPLLIEHFLDHYNRELGKRVTSVDPAVMNALTAAHLSGNVRELKNLIERAVALSTSDELLARDFLWESVATSRPPVESMTQSTMRVTGDLQTAPATLKNATAATATTRVPATDVAKRRSHHPPVPQAHTSSSTHERQAYSKRSLDPLENITPTQFSLSIQAASTRAAQADPSPSLELLNISASDLLIHELDEARSHYDGGWDLDAKLIEVERALIYEMLERHQGNRTETAQALGLSLRSLRYRLKKLSASD